MYKNRTNVEPVDIVLVNPPSTSDQEFGFLSGAGAHRPPLNLINLGAVLLEHGYSVKIIDGPTLKGGLEELMSLLKTMNPRFIGITAMTAFIHTAAEAAKQIHASLPETVVILGGIHVTTAPQETLERYKDFDVGVIGEGEITLIEVLGALEKNENLGEIPGIISRKKNGRLFVTPARELIQNLDELPLPAWHLLPDYVKTYQPTLSRKTRLPSAYIVTSRGCPFGCTFCNNVVHGRTFRSYSVDYLMKIVDHMVSEYNVRDLTIYDENLALNKERINQFCNRLIEQKYDLTWSCDARADSVSSELLELMYRAGCRSIWYGMESGNANILKRYQKGLTLKHLEDAARLTRLHNIKACGSFIIGGPEETPATIKDTIRFAKKIGLSDFVPFYYTPIPGTPDYPAIKKYGIVELGYTYATMTRPTFAPHGMTFRQVQYWYFRSLFSIYMRPKILVQKIKEIGFTGILHLFISTGYQALKRVLRMFFKKILCPIRKN